MKLFIIISLLFELFAMQANQSCYSQSIHQQRSDLANYTDLKSIKIEKLDSYLKEFKFLTSKTVKYVRNHYESILDTVQSTVFYSNLTENEADEAGCVRDLVNINQKTPFKHFNKKLLGCETSLANEISGKRSTEAWKMLQPGNQLSIEMKVSILTENGDPLRKNGQEQKCVVLSIPGPALDTRSQPDFKIYVDSKGNLLEMLYRKSMSTIMDHIKCSSKNNPEHDQVVLTAVGMGYFLAELNNQARQTAMNIGSEEFAQLIIDLRKANKNKKSFDLSVADLQNKAGVATGQFWSKVNHKLAAREVDSDIKDYCGPIHCVGKIPGDWISNRSLIVNAWDPHSLIGNGCDIDQSVDGDIGKNFAVHPAHFLLIQFRSKGIKLFKNKPPIEFQKVSIDYVIEQCF